MLAAVSMALFSTASMAHTETEFTSQDWQVVCDNTRTCRIAGYQAENNSEFPVSVLLLSLRSCRVYVHILYSPVEYRGLQHLHTHTHKFNHQSPPWIQEWIQNRIGHREASPRGTKGKRIRRIKYRDA